MHPHYTSFPAPIERALDTFCLFEWQADMLDRFSARKGEGSKTKSTGWMGPEIPFVIRVTDNLLESPTPSPDTSILCREPIYSQEGEEVGERPCIHTHFGEEEAANFERFMSTAQHLVDLAKSREACWPFLHIAFGNLRKAFFAEGLDQLLWHITALEALLGEKGEGVTARLANRVSHILGGTEREQKEIRKEFKALYEFRSDLVHGNALPKNTSKAHLHTARELARRSLYWFLNYLACVAGEGEDCAALPPREDLLRLIDFSARSRAHLASMLTRVPADFPHADGWNDVEKDP